MCSWTSCDRLSPRLPQRSPRCDRLTPLTSYVGIWWLGWRIHINRGTIQVIDIESSGVLFAYNAKEGAEGVLGGAPRGPAGDLEPDTELAQWLNWAEAFVASAAPAPRRLRDFDHRSVACVNPDVVTRCVVMDRVLQRKSFACRAS
jgi:hypothetical protein